MAQFERDVDVNVRITPTVDTASIIRDMGNLLEALTPVSDLVLGYRQRYIDAGVSDFEADAIASTLHRMIMEQMITNVQAE